MKLTYPRRTNSRTRRLLATCALAAMSAVGCDDVGQRQALDVQSETNAARVAGVGTNEAVVKRLQEAANSDAVIPAVLQSQHSLGQVQLARGRAAAAELARLQLAADALVFRIAERARAAQASVTLAANYRKLDPKSTVATINDFAAQAKGNGDAKTIPDLGEAQVPTLAAVQQNKSRLEGEITRAQAAIEAATGERDAALAEAGKQSATLESQSGEARVGTAKSVAELRSKAATAGRQVSDLSNALSRLQADHAEADGLVAQLQTAVETLGAQGASLGTSGTAVEASANQQLALAKDLLEGEKESVRVLTAQLNAANKEIDAKRGEVEALYKDAIAGLTKAADGAGRYVGNLTLYKNESAGAYEAAAWARQSSTLAVDRVSLDKASAQKATGDLYAAQARAIANALGVASGIEEVSEALNVAAADPFNSDKLKKDLGDAIAAASESYTAAEATADVPLLDADLAAYKPVKAMIRIVTLADHTALADLAKSAGVAPQVVKRRKELHDAIQPIVDEAGSANVMLPALPMSLGGAKPTVPSETPAATPAAEATPDSPAVAEIRQSLRDLATKFASPEANEATIDEAMNRVLVADAMKPLVADVRGAVVSFQRLQGAMKEKYGEEAVAAMAKGASPGDATMKVPTPEEIEKNIAALQIAATDENNATLTPPNGGAPMKLVKEEGVWKVDLRELPPQVQMMAGMGAMLVKPAVVAIDQVTADVQAGKYATIAEAQAALGEAMKKAFGGFGTVEGVAPTPTPDQTPPPADAPAVP